MTNPEPRKELRDFLNDEQRRQLARYCYFDVVGSEGNHYRIYITDYSGNVVQMSKSDYPYRHYCAHINTSQHVEDRNWVKFYEDNALVQMLTIQHSERNFRAIANPG